MLKYSLKPKVDDEKGRRLVDSLYDQKTIPTEDLPAYVAKKLPPGNVSVMDLIGCSTRLENIFTALSRGDEWIIKKFENIPPEERATKLANYSRGYVGLWKVINKTLEQYAVDYDDVRLSETGVQIFDIKSLVTDLGLGYIAT